MDTKHVEDYLDAVVGGGGEQGAWGIVIVW